jgi:hypothetical protein
VLGKNRRLRGFRLSPLFKLALRSSGVLRRVQTFRDNLSVASLKVKKIQKDSSWTALILDNGDPTGYPETPVNNYHSALREDLRRMKTFSYLNIFKVITDFHKVSFLIRFGIWNFPSLRNEYFLCDMSAVLCINRVIFQIHNGNIDT